MTEKLILHCAPDNASQCVKLALEALELPYETRLVERSQAEHRTPEYLAKNPNGRIPVLETSNGVMFETAAILLWLADQHPGTVFPKVNDPTRSAALTWLFWASNTLHPCLLRIFYSDRYGDQKATRAAAKAELFQLLDILEDSWNKAKTPLLVCYVVPMMRWVAIYGGRPGWFDLGKYPSLLQAAKSLEHQEFAIRVAETEGLGTTPFSNSQLPNPPEGSVF